MAGSVMDPAYVDPLSPEIVKRGALASLLKNVMGAVDVPVQAVQNSLPGRLLQALTKGKALPTPSTEGVKAAGLEGEGQGYELGESLANAGMAALPGLNSFAGRAVSPAGKQSQRGVIGVVRKPDIVDATRKDPERAWDVDRTFRDPLRDDQVFKYTHIPPSHLEATIPQLAKKEMPLNLSPDVLRQFKDAYGDKLVSDLLAHKVTTNATYPEMGSYDRIAKTLDINPAGMDPASTLDHELTHLVQGVTGGYRGTSPAAAQQSQLRVNPGGVLSTRDAEMSPIMNALSPEGAQFLIKLLVNSKRSPHTQYEAEYGEQLARLSQALHKKISPDPPTLPTEGVLTETNGFPWPYPLPKGYKAALGGPYIPLGPFSPLLEEVDFLKQYIPAIATSKATGQSTQTEIENLLRALQSIRP